MLLDLTIRLFVDWWQSIDWSQGMPASCRNYEDGKDADVSCLPVLTQLRAEAESPARGFPWILLRAEGDDDAAQSEWALAYHQWVFSVGVVGSTALLSWLSNLFTYYQHILRPACQPQQCYLLRQLLCPLYPILDHLLARWRSAQVQVWIIVIPAELSARSEVTRCRRCGYMWTGTSRMSCGPKSCWTRESRKSLPRRSNCPLARLTIRYCNFWELRIFSFLFGV